jgi:hypothetical protein
MADAGGAPRASGAARSRGAPVSGPPRAPDPPVAATHEQQERAARIDALLAAAAGRGVDDLGELLSSQYLGSFPALQSYVNGAPAAGEQPAAAQRGAASSDSPVAQLADALECVDAIAARLVAREARRAALLATAAACGISLDKVLAKWPPERASELEVRLWCAAQRRSAQTSYSEEYRDMLHNVFARCVLFVDADDCDESTRQEALAEAQAALLQWHEDVDAIMRRLSPVRADNEALELGIIIIDDHALRVQLLSPPQWPWPMETALEQSMNTFMTWRVELPYKGLGYDYNHMLHTIPILMESSPHRRLVDILCSQRQPVSASLSCRLWVCHMTPAACWSRRGSPGRRRRTCAWRFAGSSTPCSCFCWR